MRVVIYGIAKNEAPFVERFCAAAADADEIVIADTGSTDATLDQFMGRGVLVYPIHVSPWRFDTARNAALALVDPKADVCVSLDIDEVIQPGWREALEKAWTPGTTRLAYKMWFTPDSCDWINRIHARNGYIWRHICHEALYAEPRATELVKQAPGLEVRHLPNNSPRPSYLPMLEAGVKEEPGSKRMVFYYARELFYHNRWQDAERMFGDYVYGNNSIGVNDMEAAYALRLAGICAKKLGRMDEAVRYLKYAAERTPDRRDNWLSLAEAYSDMRKYDHALSTLRRALRIESQVPHFTDDPRAYGAYIYDLGAWLADQNGLTYQGLVYLRAALAKDPNNVRLQEDEAKVVANLDVRPVPA